MLHENVLLCRDESALGDVFNQLQLSFDKVAVSVEDIITERVHQEVLDYNQKAQSYQHALVIPKAEELRLNLQKKAPFDKIIPVNAQLQVDIALKAFSNNGFFMLIDELQAETLEQMVTIKPSTVVSFIKLMPLVGG